MNGRQSVFSRWAVPGLAALAIALGRIAFGAVIASSEQPGFPAQAAVDGDRFACTGARAWAGAANQRTWWWQREFAETQTVGAILQIVGDHERTLRNAPKSYTWEISQDGHSWRPLAGAAQNDERRLYRLHRLSRAERGRFIRLNIQAAHGDFPVVREIEIWPDPQAPVLFPDWVVAVNVTHDSKLPGEGQAFVPLAKSCVGGHALQAQQIWLTDPGVLVPGSDLANVTNIPTL
ncbi:MAG: discoidin domain-containing protein [Pirellulaceae bacterium]|jgi:hypothetical protein|nr:discoidin domain-containing protein [Pirellulaceae bacterium]